MPRLRSALAHAKRVAIAIFDAILVADLDAQPLGRAVRGTDTVLDTEQRAYWRAIADPEYDPYLRSILIADRRSQRADTDTATYGHGKCSFGCCD